MVSAGEDMIEELRQRRQGGDSRITTEGRVTLRQLTTGDLADAFADALVETSVDDLSSTHQSLSLKRTQSISAKPSKIPHVNPYVSSIAFV